MKSTPLFLQRLRKALSLITLMTGLSAVSFLFAGICTYELQAQETDTEPLPPFLPAQLYRADARTLSMGEALVGDPYSISVISQNPAVLSLLDYPRSVGMGTWYDSRTNRLSHTISMPVYLGENHRLAMLMNVQHQGNQILSLWDKPAEMDPEFYFYDLTGIYSVKLGRQFSAGLSQSVTYAENELDQFTTAATVIGIQYHPDPSLSYGLVFRGIGRTPTFQILDPVVMDPGEDVTRLGTKPLSQELEIGGSFRYPVDFSPNQFVISLASSKEFGTSGLLFKGGVELWATPWLAFRGGFLVRTRTNEDGPRFGMGLKGSWIWLDYGVAYSDRRNEYQHQISITLPFCVKCTSY